MTYCFLDIHNLNTHISKKISSTTSPIKMLVKYVSSQKKLLIGAIQCKSISRNKDQKITNMLNFLKHLTYQLHLMANLLLSITNNMVRFTHRWFWYISSHSNILHGFFVGKTHSLFRSHFLNIKWGYRRIFNR